MKEKLTHIGIPVALICVIIACVTVGILRTQATQKDDAVAVTVPVELTAGGNIKGSSYGMIVTIGNESAQGSQWNQAASGAQVALERFNRSGADIHLFTEDDHGTDEGAREAVEKLASQHVSGIVIASCGSHVLAAVEAAKDKNIPVILPYENSIDGAWSLQPTTEAVNEVLTAGHPDGRGIIRIDQEGFSRFDTPAERKLSINASTDLKKFAESLVKDTAKKNQQTIVFIDADAYQQAKLAKAFQEAGLKPQIVLGPDASSPTFSEAFLKGNQSSVMNAQSVGLSTGDSIALQSDGQGRSMSAYLQMLKVLSESKDATSVMGDQKFSDVAVSADSRSHDALVALVRGTEKASSNSPENVSSAMEKMQLSPADGITAAGMDFTQYNVIQSRPTLLSATVGDVELRGDDQTIPAHVVWFTQK